MDTLELLPRQPGLPPRDFDLRAVCSKGTYIRTLCHDIGAALGCGGCMAALRRVRSGRFTLEDALTFEEISALLEENALESRLFSTDSVFSDLPEVRLNAEGDIRAGAVPPRGELCRVYDSGGAFCQIGQARELDRGGTAIFCKINFVSKE